MQKIINQVVEKGYAMLPGWLPEQWSQRLVMGLDRLAEEYPSSKRLMPHEPFLELLAAGVLEPLIQPLLGSDYLFHHANGKMMTDGKGKPWHHDYDGVQVWNGSIETMMIHLMLYPAGLSANHGPLVVRPGSHRFGVPRHAAQRYEYQREDSDSLIVGEPGLVVILNSALWHMRPPSPAGTSRYYLNFSFIGPAAVIRPEREEYSALLPKLPEQVDNEQWRQRLRKACKIPAYATAIAV